MCSAGVGERVLNRDFAVLLKMAAYVRQSTFGDAKRRLTSRTIEAETAFMSCRASRLHYRQIPANLLL